MYEFLDDNGLRYYTEKIRDKMVWEKGLGEHSVQTAGTECVARGENSVAEGELSHTGVTETIEDWREGKGAHAGGGNTTAAGNYSNTWGNSTVANNPYEHAGGHFNVSNFEKPVYPSAGNTISSIGIGTNLSNRKNAVEVMQNGDVYLIGVGGYDGTNVSTASTIQEIVSETEGNKLDKLTTLGEHVYIHDGNQQGELVVSDTSYAKNTVIKTDDNNGFSLVRTLSSGSTGRTAISSSAIELSEDIIDPSCGTYAEGVVFTKDAIVTIPGGGSSSSKSYRDIVVNNESISIDNTGYAFNYSDDIHHKYYNMKMGVERTEYDPTMRPIIHIESTEGDCTPTTHSISITPGKINSDNDTTVGFGNFGTISIFPESCDGGHATTIGDDKIAFESSEFKISEVSDLMDDLSKGIYFKETTASSPHIAMYIGEACDMAIPTIRIGGTYYTSASIRNDNGGISLNLSNVTDIVEDIHDGVYVTQSELYKESCDRITSDGNLQSQINTINGKISPQATSSNKLVSASEMGDAISSVEAKQLYATSSQGSFATKSTLTSATTFYNADGTVAIPTKNDVAYVLADESHDNKSAKYVIANVEDDVIVWGFVITFSDTTFTQAQMDAINSNITNAKRQSYDEHIADSDIHVTTTDKTNWNDKQDAISDLNDIRSGAALGATAVQKVNTANTVYGVNNSGSQITIAYSTSNVADSIVRRDANGRVSVSDPSSNNDAVNLSYFNSHIPTEMTTAELNEILAIL